jgi:hypothetical protein
MKRIKITINTENAAFGDDPRQEIAHILSKLVGRIISGAADGGALLMDSNGNRVGEYEEWED